MTLDQAVERCKLDIPVTCHGPYLTPFGYAVGWAINGKHMFATTEQAKQAYLTAIKELESQYVPGCIR